MDKKELYAIRYAALAEAMKAEDELGELLPDSGAPGMEKLTEAVGRFKRALYAAGWHEAKWAEANKTAI